MRSHWASCGRRLRVTALLMLAASMTATGNGGRQPVQQPATGSSRQLDVRSQPSFFAFLGNPARTRLSRFDPDSLLAVGPSVPILEYHWQAAASPDGSRIAVAIGSPSVGSVRIIDVETLEFVTTKAGIAAEAVEWLDSDRVAAALACVPTNPGNRGGCRSAIVIDARSGDVLGRWPLADEDATTLLYEPPQGRPKPVARTRFGVAFLMRHVNMTTGAILALVSPTPDVRWVSLDRIEIGLVGSPAVNRRSWGPYTAAGLAVNPAGDRAYVVGAESEVAEVNLQTLAITHHRVDGLPRLSGVFRRSAVWFGDRYLVVFGHTLEYGATAGSQSPDGVRLIDTTTWQTQVVEPRAIAALVSDGWLIAYGGSLDGLVGMSETGARWTSSADDAATIGTLLSLHAAGGRVYVSARDHESRFTIHRLDRASGRIVMSVPSDDVLVDLISVAR